MSMFYSSIAQINTDSLWKVWNDSEIPDTSRLEAIYQLGLKLADTYPDSTFILSDLIFDHAKELQIYQAKAIHLQAVANNKKGDYATSIKNGIKALNFPNEIFDIPLKSKFITNLAYDYFLIGDYQSSINYFEKAMALEGIPNENLSQTLNTIGVIYTHLGDYSKALKYLNQCLEINKKMGYQYGIARNLNNIGAIYYYQGEYPKALEYYEEVLNISLEHQIKKQIAVALLNLGETNEKQGNYDQALDYLFQSLKSLEEINAYRLGTINMIDIGITYKRKGNYQKAISWCGKGFEAGEKSQSFELQRLACQCLYESYKSINDSNRALRYIEKMLVAEDSLQSDKTAQKLLQMEFSKQQLADSLQQVEENLKVKIAHQAELNQKNRTRNILLGSGFLILLLAVGLWSRLSYIRKSKAEIEKEKDRSENLLLNILPAEVAQELKEKGKSMARTYDMVSILFTDFKSFTKLSEQVSPEELVTEVNACFEAFDNIVEKYKIEKIKTIGDSYMAAGNLPVPIEDAEKKTILAALEMQEFISKRKKERDAKALLGFEMRVGIHTGPVVAGIVGIKKFQYDLWGDTVNTASRMENQSQVGEVNISQDTYELLKDDADFSFEKRGKIEVKGKGMMEMYFVKKS